VSRSFCILCSRCYDHSTVFLIRKTNRVALAGILFAVILSQTNPVFTKLLLKEEWTPLGMYFLALLVMAIVLALHEFMLLEAGEKWEMDRRDIKGTLLTTLTGGILAPILFLNGLRFVQASEAVLISSLSPLFIVMFAVCMLQEKFNRNMFVGAAFLLAGTVVLLWKDVFHAELSLGAPLILFSSLASALTTTLHKKYVRHRHLAGAGAGHRELHSPVLPVLPCAREDLHSRCGDHRRLGSGHWDPHGSCIPG